MKMQIQDLAALLSGITVVITDCSIQVVMGVPAQNGEEEPEGADGRGMGFLAGLEGPEEEDEELDDEEVVEEPIARCRKSAVRATTKRGVNTSGEVAQADKKPRKSLKVKA
jgi:hypothetical protein